MQLLHWSCCLFNEQSYSTIRFSLVTAMLQGSKSMGPREKGNVIPCNASTVSTPTVNFVCWTNRKERYRVTDSLCMPWLLFSHACHYQRNIHELLLIFPYFYTVRLNVWRSQRTTHAWQKPTVCDWQICTFPWCIQLTTTVVIIEALSDNAPFSMSCICYSR